MPGHRLGTACRSWTSPVRATALVLCALLCACGEPGGSTGERGGGLVLSRTLGVDADAGFAEIEAPLRLEFPQDHGPHPDFRIEWWYATALLQDADGRDYGVQFALFRYALQPEQRASRDDWHGAQIYMAHASVLDRAADDFRFAETQARGAAGLAGAATGPFHAFVNHCEARQLEPDAASPFPMELRCGGAGLPSADSLVPDETAFSYQLRLETDVPPVLHGEEGYSRKSDAGGASAYYSYPFLRASGTLQLGAREVQVAGTAWYDHEWTSSVLGPGQAGWDWLSLRLSDGRALMLFHIRDAAGAVVSVRGTLIGSDGRPVALGADDIDAQPTGYWNGANGHARYPVRWRVRVPTADLDLQVEPLREDQELRTSVRYWEGAMRAHGTAAGKAVSGEGFLELTGY